MNRTIIKNCHATVGKELKIATNLDIVISRSIIEEIGYDIPTSAEDEIINGRGKLVTAGLINGHVHSNEHFQKGRYDNLPLELWVPFVRPAKPVRLTPRQVYLRTMIGALEALRSGTTTVVDDMIVPALLEREHLEAAMEAYQDVGIRALVGVSIIDRPVLATVPYIEQLLPPELLHEVATGSPDPAPQIALVHELARTRHPRHSRVGCILTPSAPQRCSAPLLAQLRKMADEYALPTIIHVQETRLQVVTGLQQFGTTLVQHLDALGFLAPDTSLVHAVWLSPKDVDVISRSSATVQHNPLSNLKLASGLLPITALVEAGVNVSLGSDGCSSTDTLDMLKVVSTTALVHKLRGHEPKRWVGAADAWRFGTQGGAKALGLGNELGTVEVGRWADLVLWDLNKISFVPLNDPLQQLVYAGDKSCLDSVLVDGRLIINNSAILTIDESALIDEIREEHLKLLPEIERVERDARRCIPHYRQIYDRCLADKIPPDIYPANFSDC